MDFASIKAITIPQGDVKMLHINGTLAWQVEVTPTYTNQVPISTEADGVTIYNGGLGYKNGYRVRSGGAEGAQTMCCCTGFIPVKAGDIVRLSGYDVKYENVGNAINVSDASRTNLGQIVANSAWSSGIFEGNTYNWGNAVILEKDDVYYWVVPDGYGIAYVRVTGYTDTGENMIVTVNEEIK